MTADTLGVWILVSVVGSRDRPHIHLPPQYSLSQYKKNKKKSPTHRCAELRDTLSPKLRSKFQGSKETKGSKTEVLLARKDEDEAVAAIPEVVRVTAAAAEAQLAIVATPDTEHLEVAVRVGNRFHPDEEPFAFRLVLVLQTQLRTDFVRAELEAELDGTVVDVRTFGTLFEAEVGHGDKYEVHFRFFGSRRESGLAEDVVPPVADVHSALLNGFAEVVCVFGTSAEFDGFPYLPDLRSSRDDHFAREEALNAVYSAEFVDNSFDLSEVEFVVFHLCPSNRFIAEMLLTARELRGCLWQHYCQRTITDCE